MKECIPLTCKYEYFRERSVHDKLFKEGVKAMEYQSYTSLGRSKKHDIAVSNRLNEEMRNTRFSVNVQRLWGKSWQFTNCCSYFLSKSSFSHFLTNTGMILQTCYALFWQLLLATYSVRGDIFHFEGIPTEGFFFVIFFCEQRSATLKT